MRRDGGQVSGTPAIAAPTNADLATALQYYASGQLTEAEELCRRVLRAEPRNPEAFYLLGRTVHRLGNPAIASAFLRKALALNPNDPEYHDRLGKALLDQGKLDEALGHFRQALALDPRVSDAHRHLGQALEYRGEHDEALRVWRRGLEHDPADAGLRAAIARLEARRTLGRISDDEIVRMFDGYAAKFDAHLRDKLAYRTPELIVEAIAGVRGGDNVALDILDAGCGTGLCGPLLRPFARRLVGVDLSPGMLDQARARGAYDELHAGELVATLAGLDRSYDLIVSADVLVYFGELAAIFAGAAGALRPGGLFAASYERAAPPGYTFQVNRRYAHSAAYIRETAQAAGLIVVGLSECTLRLEWGQPVPGYISLLQRPGAPDGRRPEAEGAPR